MGATVRLRSLASASGGGGSVFGAVPSAGSGSTPSRLIPRRDVARCEAASGRTPAFGWTAQKSMSPAVFVGRCALALRKAAVVPVLPLYGGRLIGRPER